MAEKMTTDILRVKVAAKAVEDLGRIQSFFHPESVPVEALASPRNWSRLSKERSEDGNWLRVFDCRPLDDQLRAYVFTDVSDGNLLSITFEGE
ncbi:MAG: hypothetical protein BWY99_02077 [Synergistetes bacterium ADurb.BinA166]|nr:MAG: hypothetical protein BWY99_02077 [Synergistetes bacterium ADurb.BinA166]